MAHAWKGEEKTMGMGFSSYHVHSWGQAQGVSIAGNFTRCLPRPTFLLFLFLFRYSWRHQLREFKSEYRVVALDLRGYGESDAPTHQESYKLDCLIADIKDILDSLGRLAL